jgi:hypothetical protein
VSGIFEFFREDVGRVELAGHVVQGYSLIADGVPDSHFLKVDVA